MKKFFALILLCTALAVFPACEGLQGGFKDDSVKSLTKPYIAEYECVEARLGEYDILKDYEFIKMTMLDGEELEISYKPKNGEKKTVKGQYAVNPETRELTCEIGLLGYSFKEKTVIEKGEFVITKNVRSMPLIMKFKMK